MVFVISLLLILVVTILVNRVAAVALMLTGMSRESAKFQARSAFTGVGWATREAEEVMNHPTRRHIVMALMLLGNAGIVSAVASLLLTFVDAGDGESVWVPRTAMLVGGTALLWIIASSDWIDRWLSKAIGWLLHRFTSIEARDWSSLMHLADDYKILEKAIGEGHWLVGKRLREVRLRQAGIVAIGIERSGGPYVGVPHGETRVEAGDRLIVYGKGAALAALDDPGTILGDGAPAPA